MDKVVATKIASVKALGVKIETNVISGRTVTIDSLLDEEGFDAVFMGSGAGLSRFMNIPGEHYNGVFSANEFLTRNNLMKAYRDDYDTLIHAGKKVVVVGGGNVAMDAARTALRLGAESTIVYRRTEKELPARAEEEGFQFAMLTNPVEVIGDEKGWVKAIKCIRMEYGATTRLGVFAGGDAVTGAATVILAMGAGRKAAAAIHKYIQYK